MSAPQDAASESIAQGGKVDTDVDAVAAARERWKDAKAKGFGVTYWRMDGEGRWKKSEDGAQTAEDG